MPKVKKCKRCGKEFLTKHFNQQYCSVACRKLAQIERDLKAQSEREQNRKFGMNKISKIHNSTSCRELWEQYYYFRRRKWIAEQAKIERLLKDKKCWFKRKFSLTKEEKQLAEKREKQIA